MIIENVLPEDYAELLNVWENSVRATHNFISDADITFFKPIIITQAFPAVTLACTRDERENILGFVGIDKQKVEMLFVLDQARGTGVGKALLQYALTLYKVNSVDVNEQNPQAVGFYQHMGFNIVSRSDTDGMGKPFPILHMKLSFPVP
ncbi:GNAT family N-acetyltransferase [Neptunicella sp. SCSIO 80796]|uniref:GNAT family N-acetyltransferase n=1 Tax=Neptunicella plasticusilytica TaxID=3117012 RepID=UPI003A4D676E